MNAFMDGFVAGKVLYAQPLPIAPDRGHATCLWNVAVGTDDQIEMLAKGLKYAHDNEEVRRVSLDDEWNSTLPKKEGGRIELVFSSKLPNNVESFLNLICTHNVMVESLRVEYALTPEELLPLVRNLPTLGILAKLILSISREFLVSAKVSLVLYYLHSCPLLAELTLCNPRHILEMPSTLVSSLEPLLSLSSSAAEALSRSLQSQYCSLVTLTLNDCRLQSNAFDQLAIGIGRNISLRTVAFLSCQLGSADFEVLADTLKDNKTLKEVVIEQGGMIGKEAIQALEQWNQNISFTVPLEIFATRFEQIDDSEFC